MNRTATVQSAIGVPNGTKTRRARKATPVLIDSRVSNGDRHLQWIPISEMAISPVAQRRHDSPSSRAKIEDIAANFDPDKFGTLTVNLRDGVYYVIDGGHRYLSMIVIGWEDQQVQCWMYEGLSESEEADKFLSLNDVKVVSNMDKFKQGVVAKRPMEVDIDRIVRAADLRVGPGGQAISCIGAIQKIYTASGPAALATTLRVIRDSFGMPGFTAKIVAGVGMFVDHYGDAFKEDILVQRLAAKRGGATALTGEAERVSIKYSVTAAVGVAAAVAETYNRGRSGPRLATWWSTYGGVN